MTKWNCLGITNINMKNNYKKLEREFFLRDDVVEISKNLLGKILITKFNNVQTSGMIVETEAYRAPEDKASHAYNNRKTARTEVMYNIGGTVYVYLIYGMYHLFNIVTAEEGLPHAVLIRAIEPLENTDLMQNRRKVEKLTPNLTSGPGKLTIALGINGKHNGLDLCNNDEVYIEDRGILIRDDNMIAGPRVGVSYAEECADWPYRFRIKKNNCPSK